MYLPGGILREKTDSSRIISKIDHNLWQLQLFRCEVDALRQEVRDFSLSFLFFIFCLFLCAHLVTKNLIYKQKSFAEEHVLVAQLNRRYVWKGWPVRWAFCSNFFALKRLLFGWENVVCSFQIMLSTFPVPWWFKLIINLV